VPGGRTEAATLPVVVTIDGETAFAGDVPTPPVRQRSVHLLPHSHVDIGYSDPQPDVERKQWKNLRDAVALGIETASYPPAARFKWNVEGLWSVEGYLAQATPAERDAFAAAVREGTIGLQANDANILTGLAVVNDSLAGRIPLFNLDLGRAKVGGNGNVLKVDDVAVTLNKVAAATLNEIFNVTAFTENFPIGTADVRAILDNRH